MADFFDLVKEILQNNLQLTTYQPGATIFKQDDPGDAMYIVTRGRLEVHVQGENGQQILVGEIGKGNPVGEMQMLTGGKRTATVKAIEESELLEIPAAQLALLSIEYPNLFEKFERLILQRLQRNHLLLLLPELFGKLDEDDLKELEPQLEWRYLVKGERLFHMGDEGDEMYIVLSGRLHVLVEDLDGAEKTILEIGRGESVGEMALFNNAPRSAHVDAIRNCILIKISKKTFFSMMAKYPALHEHVTRVIMRRLQLATNPTKPEVSVVNIAILPLSDAESTNRFTEALEKAITFFGSTLLVSRSTLSRQANFRPSTEWFDDPSDNLRFAVWLDEVELAHRFILFEADPYPSKWTKRIIQYADVVLLLADVNDSPDLTKLEQECLDAVSQGQKVLIIQHPESTPLPSGTRAWLTGRQVKRHLHIRKNNTQDVLRVARVLAGRAMGLVLGGGGARGFAHIGIIKAMRQLGLPVDMVGGTSMGAVIAAHAAMELPDKEILYRNRQAFVESRPFRRQILPIFSFYKGKMLDHVTREILYQDYCLEDLWLPCFVVSCSLGTSELIVHEEGKIWEAIRASTALPGIVTPVLDGTRLHVDGGLMNNLPVDLMRERTGGPIIAVEVSDMTDLDAQDLEPPSLIDYFKTKWFTRKHGNFPTILEILMRSLLLGSQQTVKLARQNADLVLRPPVGDFGLLQFDAIENIAEEGYRFGMEELPQWLASITVTKVV